MATVRQLVIDLADGLVGLDEVTADFATRVWPQDPVPTPEQLAGVHDVPLPDPGSFDWVDMSPHLSRAQKQALRAAHDRAVQ